MAKRIAAGRFRDRCLQILGEVSETRTPVVVTKHGRPFAVVVPCARPPLTCEGLSGSILFEAGNPYETGDW
jgi:prevent-host-death family protein